MSIGESLLNDEEYTSEAIHQGVASCIGCRERAEDKEDEGRGHELPDHPCNSSVPALRHYPAQASGETEREKSNE